MKDGERDLKLPHRIVWLFGFGYFLAYAPYAASVKEATQGGTSGFFLLPGAIAGTVVLLPLLIVALGFHRHLGCEKFSWSVIASGIGTASIIATTTIASSFSGISIVLALLLMRGGVLALAPVVDPAAGRRVRWFSRVALGLSLTAVAIALSDVKSYAMPVAAILNLVFYLGGYCVRLPMVTRCAKVEDPVLTRRYFTQEAIVAMITMMVVPIIVAIAAPHSELGRGVTDLWTSKQLVPSLIIGGLYSVLYVFGALVYLDRRENTFCIPLNRGASLLSGIAATYVLASFTASRTPSASELIASALIITALVLLSPAHHTAEVLVTTWRLSRTAESRRLPLE